MDNPGWYFKRMTLNGDRSLLLTWIDFNPSTETKSQNWRVAALKLGMNKWFNPTLHNVCNYLFMPGLKFIHASKRGPRILIQGSGNNSLWIGAEQGTSRWLIEWWLRGQVNWYIERDCRMYTSVNYANIGSDNCLLPVRRETIIWTNAG